MRSLPPFARLAALAGWVVVLCESTASAYLPLPDPDCEIARNAEVIVVGRLLEGSVEHLPVEEDWGNRKVTMYRSRATLRVTEVAAGKLEEKQIAVWFCNGATPLVGGKFEWAVAGQRPLRFRIVRDGKEYPPGSIQLAGRFGGFYSRPELGDLRDDHAWLLRSYDDLPTLPKGRRAWGVESWDCVAKAGYKDYFLAYRSPDPRKALLAEVPKHPELAETIDGYVHYLDAVDSSRIADPNQRAAKLLPLLVRRQPGWIRPSAVDVARKGLLAAGEPAGRMALEQLSQAKDRHARSCLIRLLGELKYLPALDTLIRMLREHNAIWKDQEPRKFEPRDESPANRRLHESFWETNDVVEALGGLADPRAKPVLEETLDLWRRLGYGYLTGACESALWYVEGKPPPDEDAPTE